MNLLIGQVCYDIYKDSNLIVPGGGILHNAYHLQKLGCNPKLITRIGERNKKVFLEFFEKNDISIVRKFLIKEGNSASIDIFTLKSGDVKVTNLVKGVWKNFYIDKEEEDYIKRSDNIHLVLVEEIVSEFNRLCYEHKFENAFVSVDLLDMRYSSLKDLNKLLKFIDIAFIGWKGSPKDRAIREIEKIAENKKVIIIITFGEKGVEVINSKEGKIQLDSYKVKKVKVKENTNGCGDAFISYFLSEYWKSQDVKRAIRNGMIGGKKATFWKFALPDFAYN